MNSNSNVISVTVLFIIYAYHMLNITIIVVL